MSKPFLFAVFLLLGTYGQCQPGYLAKGIRKDTVLEHALSQLILASGQYFHTSNTGVVILFCIVPDQALQQKDSLFMESRYLYRQVRSVTGSKWADNIIDIAFIGKQSDAHHLAFHYEKDHYGGQVNYTNLRDTLLAPDSAVRSRLDHIGSNKLVRHEKNGDLLNIVFEIVVKNVYDIDQKQREKDALKIIVQYLQEPFINYEKIKIKYADAYNGKILLYEVRIPELIINYLTKYYSKYF